MMDRKKHQKKKQMKKSHYKYLFLSLTLSLSLSLGSKYQHKQKKSNIHFYRHLVDKNLIENEKNFLYSKIVNNRRLLFGIKTKKKIKT